MTLDLTGDGLADALRSMGIPPTTTQRVVIDIQPNRQPVIYVQRVERRRGTVRDLILSLPTPEIVEVDHVQDDQ